MYSFVDTFASATRSHPHIARMVAFSGSLFILGGNLLAQGSATLGNGLSAAATARGGTVVAEHSSPLDAVQGNPAGLAGVSTHELDLSAIGMIAGGSFQNSANQTAGLHGIAGALPYGAFVTPLGNSHWSASAAVTPEILMRADWHYLDPAGLDGVTYGYRAHETEIVAIRSSLGVARTLGSKWSAGATLGIVYNQNDLHAPYIFQQEPHLAGLKVLLDLTTRGYGWNGAAGVQWQPTSTVRASLAWKSGTTLSTTGEASGSAYALFAALGIPSDPTFTYRAHVENHLPQAFGGGLTWQTRHHFALSSEGDMTAWGQAFQQLPIHLTRGSNVTINSVVGSNNFHDAVPLHWRNQGAFHTGFDVPVSESVKLRAGYSWAANPVPSSTLMPMTAAILQNSLATGTGWSHGRWTCDAAYQTQLPATQSVGISSILAGEYSKSKVRVWTQSVIFTTRFKF